LLAIHPIRAEVGPDKTDMGKKKIKRFHYDVVYRWIAKLRNKGEVNVLMQAYETGLIYCLDSEQVLVFVGMRRCWEYDKLQKKFYECFGLVLTEDAIRKRAERALNRIEYEMEHICRVIMRRR
jgi:hypothetical protein